jgi:hypothetical protein
MRSYWMRILLGAAAIFAIGMVGVTLYRRGVVKVNQVVAGSGPLTIPLPFVPFELDGNRLGTVERLVVNRDAPKKVSSVDLEVKLDDSLVAQGLAGCRLAANIEGDSSSPKDFNVHVNRNSRPFFFCAGEDTSLVEFGTVTVPLLIPESVADQLESGAWDHDGAADSADVMAAQAESLAGKAQKAADSIMKLPAVQAKLKDARLRGLADSLRKAGRLRADSMFREMADSESAR